MIDPRVARYGHPTLSSGATAVKVAGWVCIVMGIISICGFGVAYTNRAPTVILVILGAAVLLVYFIPGFLYLFLSDKIKAARKWAVITTVVLLSLHSVYMILSVIRTLDNAAANPLAVAFGVGVSIVLLVALVKACGCFKPLRDLQVTYGFEPIMPGQAPTGYPNQPLPPTTGGYPLPPQSLLPETDSTENQ